ncbi:glycosyltransferase [Acidovorax sp. LjRoot66]|uniref:glycosyltransferase family protein n=1 Tax=Acidovorax sp. LjRoot66 TaxID=3342334 RepID=UPI003ECD08CB
MTQELTGMGPWGLRNVPVRLAFAVTEVGLDAAAGDYFSALELGTALAARFGWQVAYLPKGEGWYDLAGVDLLVVMVDEYELPAIQRASSHLVTIAWARNWFERWCSHAWIAAYDLHLASSRKAVGYMSECVGKRALLLRIATDVGRFNQKQRADFSTLDYVFTGSYWQAKRDVVQALAGLPSGFRGAIYGKHWEQVPELRHLHKGFVPYCQIHKVYQSASIVVDDANHVTKEWAAANSRVFDALAAGCLVITNSRAVSDEVFQGRLPVYDTPADLAQLIERYLTHHEERKGLSNELHAMVRARHTYAHRAMEFGWNLHKLSKKGSQIVEAIHCAPLPQLPAPAAVSVQKGTQPPTGSAPFQGKPLVSVVVPLFNHLLQTQAMLLSLTTSWPDGLEYEIILANDASTDGTRAWLATLEDRRIQVICNPLNQGFARTCNTGAKAARGELLCLLNNDLVLQPGWLEPMLEMLLAPALKAGIVGNVQRRVDDGALDHVGVQLTAAGQLAHMRDLNDGGPDCGMAPPVRSLAVTGACVVLRRADFWACGGFDERYRNGAEDIDLCMKLRARGQRAYVARSSCVGHHVSLSRGPASLNDERNSRLLFHRWRAEFKRELADVWRALLEHNGPYPEPPTSLVDRDLLETPHLASMRIAEALLVRQELRWAALLGPLEAEHD